MARLLEWYIIHPAGQAPRRFRPLSSNVRQHHVALKVLAIASGAAVAAEYQMHSLATLVRVRQRRSGLAQALRSAHLQSPLRSQRFAAKNRCFSTRWVQSVSGAAATRKALPSFTAGGGGGMSTCCASSQRRRVSRQQRKAMPVCFALWHRFGSPRAVLPNRSLEWTATGKALGPRTGQCHHPSRGPSASPARAPQLKR